MTEPDDALRARLAAMDPMPASLPVDPPTSPRAQDLLEQVMLTTEPSLDLSRMPRRRRTLALASAAAAVVAIAVGVVAISNDDAAPKKAQTSLALTTASSTDGGISMNSCIPFSVDLLRGVPLAFGGTVTDTTDAQVSIAVDHWYKGGEADVVTVATPPGNTSVGTVSFTVGKHYLVTATNGVVNSCGLTGEATPDLQRAFDEAFAP